MSASPHEQPNGSTFFRNVSCAYFPCHTGVDPREFNCLFCYCPLYALGPNCGGDFSYTAAGIKDCSGCTRLHQGDGGVALVQERFSQLARLAAQPAGGNGSGCETDGTIACSPTLASEPGQVAQRPENAPAPAAGCERMASPSNEASS